MKYEVEETKVEETMDMEEFLKEIEKEVDSVEFDETDDDEPEHPEETEQLASPEEPSLETDSGRGQRHRKTGESGGYQGVVAELVGPDKKFKTIEDLAIGKKNADAFIEQLIAEKRAIQKELERERETRLKLEDLLQEVRNMNKRETINMDNMNEDRTPLMDREMLETNPNDTAGDLSAIEKLVESVLNRKEQEARKVSAWGKLMADMSNKYGEKAQEVLQARLKELNISEETFERLVVENPEAAETLVLGRQAHGGGDVSPIGDSRGLSLERKPGDMTLEEAIKHGAPKSFWDSYKAKLKKEHGSQWSRYWLDRRVQKAILASAHKLGERFFQ